MTTHGLIGPSALGQYLLLLHRIGTSAPSPCLPFTTAWFLVAKSLLTLHHLANLSHTLPCIINKHSFEVQFKYHHHHSFNIFLFVKYMINHHFSLSFLKREVHNEVPYFLHQESHSYNCPTLNVTFLTTSWMCINEIQFFKVIWIDKFSMKINAFLIKNFIYDYSTQV